MIIQNKGVYIRHVGDVRLIPGANELTEKQAEAFEAALSNPLDNALIDKELFIVGGLKGSNSNGITDIKSDDALLLIEDTFDLELLAKWAEEEASKKSKARKTVIKAIEDRVDSLENPPADDRVNDENGNPAE